MVLYALQLIVNNKILRELHKQPLILYKYNNKENNSMGLKDRLLKNSKIKKSTTFFVTNI